MKKQKIKKSLSKSEQLKKHVASGGKLKDFNQFKPIPSGIPCVRCEEDIPQQRIDALTKMGRKVFKCTNCSDEKTKKPIILQKGEGDHTYTETIIVDDETYKKYEKFEEANRRQLGIKKDDGFGE